jgi:hypothetical protein
MLRSLLATLALIVAMASLAEAGEPKKKAQPEFVPPAPKQIDPAFPPTPMVKPITMVVVPYYRTDTREVWMHYAPNRMGRMVPKVLATPYGDFYSRTLEPYPWAGVSKTAVLPIIVD